MEQLTVTMFFAAGIVVRHGLSADTVLLISLSFISVYCAFSDLDRRVIPNEALKAGALYRMLTLPLSGNVFADLFTSLQGAAVMAAILLPVAVMYERLRHRGAIGGGDIKLLILAGAYIGAWNSVLSLFAACILALLFRYGKRKTFPWGPYIAAGLFPILVK